MPWDYFRAVKEDSAKSVAKEEDRDDAPWAILLLLLLVVAIGVGAFLLRGDSDETNLLPDQPIELDSGPDYSGKTQGDRYLGPLVSFRIPDGLRVQGSSDGYSEEISWRSGPASGQIVATPRIPGETLSSVEQANGEPAEETQAGSRSVLFRQGRIGSISIAQVDLLAGDLKVMISSSSPNGSEASRVALEIAATLAPSRGRG